MNESTSIYLFYIHLVSFLSWFACVFFSIFQTIKSKWHLYKWSWLLVFAIVIAGCLFRQFGAPHKFRIFYDEYEIVTSSNTLLAHHDFAICKAGTIAECEKTIMQHRAPGIIFVSAMAMKITGNHGPEVVFELNVLLGALSLLMIAGIVIASGGSGGDAAYATALAAVMPLHILLSTNASSEMLNFLIICSFWMFFALSLIGPSPSLSTKVGLCVSLICAILSRPENIILPIFIYSVLETFTDDTKTRTGATYLKILIPGLIPFIPLVNMYYTILMTNRQHIYAFYDLNPLRLTYMNLWFIAKNVYIPTAFLLAAAVGCILSFRKLKRFDKIILSYFVFWFAYLCILKICIYQGDFPRHILILTLPIVLFGARAWGLMVKMHRARIGQAFILLVLISPFFFFQSVLQPFHPALERLDMKTKDLIRSFPKECSVFSNNPVSTFIYSDNRAYEMESLLEPEFLAKHHECKIVIFDMFCASGSHETCQDVSNRFPIETTYREIILGDYEYTVGRIIEK